MLDHVRSKTSHGFADEENQAGPSNGSRRRRLLRRAWPFSVRSSATGATPRARSGVPSLVVVRVAIEYERALLLDAQIGVRSARAGDRADWTFGALCESLPGLWQVFAVDHFGRARRGATAGSGRAICVLHARAVELELRDGLRSAELDHVVRVVVNDCLRRRRVRRRPAAQAQKPE